MSNDENLLDVEPVEDEESDEPDVEAHLFGEPADDRGGPTDGDESRRGFSPGHQFPLGSS
jgi:hypothetical protein